MVGATQIELSCMTRVVIRGVEGVVNNLRNVTAGWVLGDVSIMSVEIQVASEVRSKRVITGSLREMTLACGVGK